MINNNNNNNNNNSGGGYYGKYTDRIRIIKEPYLPSPSLLAGADVWSGAVSVMLTCIGAFGYCAVVPFPSRSALTRVRGNAGALGKEGRRRRRRRRRRS